MVARGSRGWVCGTGKARAAGTSNQNKVSESSSETSGAGSRPSTRPMTVGVATKRASARREHPAEIREVLMRPTERELDLLRQQVVAVQRVVLVDADAAVKVLRCVARPVSAL